MAHIIYPDAGLNRLILHGLEPTVQYRLFVNDVTPDRDSVAGDFTQAAWSGYAPINIDVADWTAVTPTIHKGKVTHDDINFANSSGSDENAYGYYVVTLAGLLLAAMRFDGAPLIVPAGDILAVRPVHGDRSGFTS